MDVPVDNNPESISIVEKEIGAKPIQECTFFSGKELPTKHLSEVFGIASALVFFHFSQTIDDQSNTLTWALIENKNHYISAVWTSAWLDRNIYQFTASHALEGLASNQLSPSDAQILYTSQHSQ